MELRLPEAAVEKALATFQGVERRLIVLGRRQNTVFIEDFAHHPTAIAQVLGGSAGPLSRATRSWPFSNRAPGACAEIFFRSSLPASLAAADEIVIKDVYEKEKIPAGERLDIARIKKELEAMGKGVQVFRIITRSSNSWPPWIFRCRRSSFCFPTATCAISPIGPGT